ncbi:MAG: tetratricopeptide repeat protein [Bacteroidota bacterium]|nr:MAG: tetratricopeptide repeat protein [Bacteroidota bacterium]
MKNFLALLAFIFFQHFSFAQISVLDTLSNVLMRKIEDSTKIDLLNKKITEFSAIQPEYTLLYSDSAIELSISIRDSARLAHSISRKAVAQYYLGDFNSSMENYFLSLSIKDKIGDNESVIKEYNNIGLILNNLENYKIAAQYFELALNILEKNKGDRFIKALALNNLGVSYRGLKQYDSAKVAYKKALEINTEIGALRSKAHNLNNLGNLYFLDKDYNSAIDYLSQALELNRSLYNNYEEAQNLCNLADVYLATNDYTKALSHLNDAEKIILEINADYLKTRLLNLYSNYYSAKKMYREAYIYRDKYALLRDSIIQASRVKQFDQLKNLANAEKEIQKVEFLRQINTLQEKEIRVQRFMLIGGSLLLLSILTLLFITLKNLKTIKQLNIKLLDRTYEIETLNEELYSTNEELHAQRDNLEIALTTLQATQKQLIHAEKMASIGVLASGVAHEINNPLNYIMGGIVGIENYLSKNLNSHLEELSPLINAINTGVDRAAAIVTSLNHYSSIGKSSITECDVHALIDNCLDMLQDQITNKAEIKRIYNAKPRMVFFNENKLQQAIFNILLNAVQSIESDGKITITTFGTEDNFSIKIEDNGCGISKENLSKVFDPFFTTKDPGKGAGLGLSIAYNIFKEQNGSIELDSVLNKGTCVTIQFSPSGKPTAQEANKE